MPGLAFSKASTAWLVIFARSSLPHQENRSVTGAFGSSEAPPESPPQPGRASSRPASPSAAIRRYVERFMIVVLCPVVI